MNKIKEIVLIMVVFSVATNAWSSRLKANAEIETGMGSQAQLQLIYHNNIYILNQLEKLLRVEGKKPYRIGAQLEKVDTAMMVVKISSLNFLMRKEAHPEIRQVYNPFEESLILDTEALIQQNLNMLQNLHELMKKYVSVIPDKYEQSFAVSWFTSKANLNNIYQQFVHIESYLYGLKNIIEPKGVYAIILSTREFIMEGCPVNNIVSQIPLVMGKRPKDVYKQLFLYLEKLSSHVTFSVPDGGAVHILPQDVFDVAIIAMVYSRPLHGEKNLLSSADVRLEKIFKLVNKYEIITPSHVYQAVAQNIEILECQSNAS